MCLDSLTYVIFKKFPGLYPYPVKKEKGGKEWEEKDSSAICVFFLSSQANNKFIDLELYE